jgi:hypothetical protein
VWYAGVLEYELVFERKRVFQSVCANSVLTILQIIGVPRLITQSCLLLNHTLTPTQLSNCTTVSSRSFAQFGRTVNGLGTLTGANTLDVASIGIDGGLLTVNATQVSEAYGRVHAEVVVQDVVRADGIRADGIRADGSFGQHGGIIYNGNYGKD